MPAPNIIDPVPPVPANFDWLSSYQGLKYKLQEARASADWGAHRAISRAIANIDNRLAEQHQSVLKVPLREDETLEPEAAFRDLQRHWHRLWTRERKVSASAQARALVIGNAIKATERLTHRSEHELALRESVLAPLREAQSAPDRQARAGFPDPMALSYWLWHERCLSLAEESQEDQAAAESAREATRLLSEVRNKCGTGSDPWTVSRAFIRERHAELGPSPMMRRLQATHDRMSHAMVNPALSPGSVAQVTEDYDWHAHYSDLTAQLERCTRDGDTAGAELRRALIEEIDDCIVTLCEVFHLQVGASSNHSVAMYNALVESAKRAEQAASPNALDFHNHWALKMIHAETRSACARVAEHSAQLPELWRAASPDTHSDDGESPD